MREFISLYPAAWVVIRILITLLATYGASRVFRILWKKSGKDKIHHKFFCNMFNLIIWLSGFGIALHQLPFFESAAGTLLAGSGIAALTIGLAAQESLGNAVNGMFISMFRPFEVGDRVHLVNANITVFIEDITIRHTVIRTFINSRIIVPNSVINKELIENSSFIGQKASAFVDVTITYDSDIDKAREIMAGAVSGHRDFDDPRTPEQIAQGDPVVYVFVRNLGLYGVELRASMWTRHVNINFAACSDVRYMILKEFEAAGIRIASSKIIDSLLQG